MLNESVMYKIGFYFFSYSIILNGLGGLWANKWIKTSLITIFIKKYNISVIIKKPNY
ncbi:hypothetical protein THIOM_002685 [Candidatus Thiomargarita nelsonii]|uniref:Uncharacterized protein n=1 Tax=Candidatus Thiomargarita nelsonii TaxID=1003181 RepID=A0A176S0E3_9GAMM|nr:hypothetical protein THIOM_002685 [Candidatus Thiomargarita nelsonii]